VCKIELSGCNHLVLTAIMVLNAALLFKSDPTLHPLVTKLSSREMDAFVRCYMSETGAQLRDLGGHLLSLDSKVSFLK